MNDQTKQIEALQIEVEKLKQDASDRRQKDAAFQEDYLELKRQFEQLQSQFHSRPL